MNINIKEEFQLYLAIKKLEQKSDKVAKLEAYFYGPCLLSNHLIKIDAQDSIILDFNKQFRIQVLNPDYYTAKLSWGNIKFTNDGRYIDLMDCLLEYNKISSLSKIGDHSFILIDVGCHLEETHYKYPMYTSYLLDRSGNIL